MTPKEIVCPSGKEPSTENINGTLFVICVDSKGFTAFDFLILLFFVLFIIGIVLYCAIRHDANIKNKPNIINGVQLYDTSFERLRDSSIPLSSRGV